MTRMTSWRVAVVAFSILTFGGFSASEAAKKHAKPHHHAAKHRQMAEILVRVVDHSGKPVAGAKVHLHKIVHHKKHQATVGGQRHHTFVTSHSAAAPHKPHHAHHRSGRTAVTNASGQAFFSHVRSGHFHVTAEKKGVGRGSAHVSLQACMTKSVTIHLHKHGKKRGHGQTGKTGQRHHAAVAPH